MGREVFILLMCLGGEMFFCIFWILSGFLFGCEIFFFDDFFIFLDCFFEVLLLLKGEVWFLLNVKVVVILVILGVLFKCFWSFLFLNVRFGEDVCFFELNIFLLKWFFSWWNVLFVKFVGLFRRFCEIDEEIFWMVFVMFFLLLCIREFFFFFFEFLECIDFLIVGLSFFVKNKLLNLEIEKIKY